MWYVHVSLFHTAATASNPSLYRGSGFSAWEAWKSQLSINGRRPQKPILSGFAKGFAIILQSDTSNWVIAVIFEAGYPLDLLKLERLKIKAAEPHTKSWIFEHVNVSGWYVLWSTIGQIQKFSQRVMATRYMKQALQRNTEVHEIRRFSSKKCIL